MGANRSMQSVPGMSTDAVLRPEPAPMPYGVTFGSAHAGVSFSCALTEDGEAYCWGSGILGNGTIGGPYDVPQQVQQFGIRFTALSAGANLMVAIATDGTAYAWGSNGRFQLGLGSEQLHTTLVRVGLPEPLPSSGVTFQR